VARSQGISPRYLQRLLETAETSFTERVNELRLQRALALLLEAGKRRISDISHFNRLFRARFGDTPSGVRAQRQTLEPDLVPAPPPIALAISGGEPPNGLGIRTRSAAGQAALSATSPQPPWAGRARDRRRARR
jgi:hypothetical protein